MKCPRRRPLSIQQRNRPICLPWTLVAEPGRPQGLAGGLGGGGVRRKRGQRSATWLRRRVPGDTPLCCARQQKAAARRSLAWLGQRAHTGRCHPARWLLLSRRGPMIRSHRLACRIQLAHHEGTTDGTIPFARAHARLLSRPLGRRQVFCFHSQPWACQDFSLFSFEINCSCTARPRNTIGQRPPADDQIHSLIVCHFNWPFVTSS